MATPSAARLDEAPPKYVRLPPDASGDTIELDAGVLQRLTGEIEAAEKLGVETGGLLFGSWGQAPERVVRIEGFELIAPHPEDGPVYMPSPQQQEQFALARQRLTNGGMDPIGFFRSHLRSGPLALSLADRGLLWKQFRSGNYLALLMEAREPHAAVFFTSSGSQVVLHSSPASFPHLNESARALPDPQESTREDRPLSEKQRRQVGPQLLTLCSVLLFAIGIVLWPAWEATFGGPWAIASSTDMALSLQRHGRNLDMTWNREMPEIARAQGATLTIVNGFYRSELPLGKDDLKFGSVAYAYKGGPVEASFTLNMQDATSLTQSAVWNR